MNSTVKTVGVVMIIMIFSRLLSLVSSMIYMPFFGVSGLEINIYNYAVNFPNIAFAAFGTALTTVVIPIFAGYMGKGEKEKAYRFANNIISLSISFTAILAFVCILAAPIFPWFTAFRENGYGYAVMALQIMFPVMVFYSLNYVLQGILQSFGKFNMPAFVSVPSSLIVIFYVLFLGTRFGVKGLLVATFIGLAMQGLILIFPLYRTDYRFRPSFQFKDEDIQRALLLIPPVLLGTAAYQFNIFFNITMTARLGNYVTVMSLAQNLILYSVLALIYSITAVVFPRLTMLAAKNDMEGFKNDLTRILRSLMFFLVPASFGFVVVRNPLIDFLVGWGKVSSEDVVLAGSLLAFYALGITGVGIKEVIDRAFYSLNDTKKPAVNGVIIMGVNVGASLLLIPYLGIKGIPLAFSISGLTGAATLMLLLRRKIGPFGGRILFLSLIRTIAASGLMFVALWPLNEMLAGFHTGVGLWDKAVRLFLPVAVGGIIYFLSAWLMQVEEAVTLANRVRGRLGI